MDELVALLEDIIKLIPLDRVPEDLRKVIQDSMTARAGGAVKRLVEHVETIARPYTAPLAGAPVDEDIPAAPSHWTKDAASDISVAPPPSGAAPADDPSIDAKLAALAPAPAELPSTTIAEQLAFAQAQQQAPAAESPGDGGAPANS